MLRTLIAVGAMLGVIATTSLAHAQARELGTPGEFIISADRLVPFFGYTRSDQHATTLPAGETSDSTTVQQTAFSILWGSTIPVPGTATNGVEVLNFFTVPRAGFDYVVVPNLTIGGDLALYFTLGSNTSHRVVDVNNVTTTTSQGAGGLVLFGLAPRVGYILKMNHLISFWLRGGLSFYTETVNGPTLNNAGAFDRVMIDQFALDLDPQVVFTPVAHFGLTAGLTADIPLSGEVSATQFNGTGGSLEESGGSSIFFFGATLGLIGFF